MPTSKSSTKMNQENLALKKSSQSAFTKAVKTIQKNIKKHEVPTEVEQNTLQPGDKEKGIKKKVPKPSDRGVVYLRHIPHGFYEEPMKAYFSQFGQVTGIKVIRSQKTGNSCGYGFVEFLHTEVAKVVAETMNNYLMFDRLIKAEYVPPEKQKRLAFSRGLNAPVVTPMTTLRAKNRAKLVRYRNKDFVNPAKIARDRKAALQRLATLERKLEEEGITFHFEPVDAELAAVESSEDDAAPVLELDLSDSEFEFNVPAGTVVKPLKRGAPKPPKGSGAATPSGSGRKGKGSATPAKVAKGTPTPAKKVKSVPAPVAAVTGLPILSKKKVGGVAGPASDDIPKIPRGGDQKNATKEAQKQAAVELYHRQMAKNKFGFGAKSNLTTAERMKMKDKKMKEGLKSTPNGKAQENGDEKTGVSANSKRGGVPLRNKSKLIAPKSITKKAILKHRGVKMTPKKTPKK